MTTYSRYHMTNMNFLFHWIVTAFAIISHVIIGPEYMHGLSALVTINWSCCDLTDVTPAINECTAQELLMLSWSLSIKKKATAALLDYSLMRFMGLKDRIGHFERILILLWLFFFILYSEFLGKHCSPFYLLGDDVQLERRWNWLFCSEWKV